MSPTEMVHVRMDKSVKAQAAAALAEIGLSPASEFHSLEDFHATLLHEAAGHEAPGHDVY